MSEVAIEIDNISKLYRLGKVGRNALKDDIRLAFSNLLGKENPFLLKGEENERLTSGSGDYVWALKDISFSINKGEVLGVIGRNGAGKSTLLKILSRVTKPTSGKVNVRGRIASLLEVGTGFHPDLTGRENIFLNAAILGMSRQEVLSKLDEIIDFSGVERYVDTPVKRYSSGMYVRLAFAVAAHLSSDILIIDEVLAVGDSEFQKKCLGKMQDVSKNHGRTVLFVSHNMAAVQSLCTHAIVMKNGKIVLPKDTTSSCIKAYNQSIIGDLLKTQFSERNDRQGNGLFRFTYLQFMDDSGNNINQPVCGMKTIIRMGYKTTQKVKNVSVAINFNSWTGESKFMPWSDLLNQNYPELEGEGYIECVLPKFPLTLGNYLINLYSSSGSDLLDWIQEAASVEVENGDFYNTGKSITSQHQTVLADQLWR